jgi:hypothetical protein
VDRDIKGDELSKFMGFVLPESSSDDPLRFSQSRALDKAFELYATGSETSLLISRDGEDRRAFLPVSD